MALNSVEIKDDIQIGDYLNIQWQIFIVLDITDDGYIISPPSRQYQTLLFYRHNYQSEADDVWALTNTIPGDMIKNWDDPDAPETRNIYFNWNHETDDQYEDSDIRIIRSEEVKVDYLRLRDILVEYTLKDETNESIPFRNYTVSSKSEEYGHDRNLVFNTRSLFGAIITYLDWLDTEKDNIDWSEDDYMWDQTNPHGWSNYVNIDGSVRVEELVEDFFEGYEHLLEEWRNPNAIGFLFSRQPQIKAIR